METYRCYFLSDDNVAAASYLLAEDVTQARKLANQLYCDRLVSMTIDSLEIWLASARLMVVPLIADITEYRDPLSTFGSVT